MLYWYKCTNTDEICKYAQRSQTELEAALTRSNVFCTSKAIKLSSKYAQRTQTELEAALARSNVERESQELQAYISIKQQ